MTVSSTTRKENKTLDGVTSAFDFTFRALTSAPTDIKCAVLSSSTTATLTYSTHYTVTIATTGIGGTVNIVSPASHGTGTLTIYRETTNKQESDYDDYNQFPADTLETDLDRRTMVSQETSEEIGRTLKAEITSTLTNLTIPNPEANKVLGWNAAGDAFENKVSVAADAIAAAILAATSATTSMNIALSTLYVSLNPQTGNYTLAATDVNKMVTLDSTGTITLTVPLNSVVPITTYSVIALCQLGAGKFTISPTNGSVTINKEIGLNSTGQYSVASLVKTGTDEWLALGALEL
jgi:hypothetical protein